MSEFSLAFLAKYMYARMPGARCRFVSLSRLSSSPLMLRESVSRQNWTPIEIRPMGPFLTSKLDRVGPILMRASNVATRVRHASNPIAKHMYVVDTLDDMHTLLSVYKVLSLTSLGL